MSPRKSSDVAVLLLFQFLPEISVILLVTAAHNPLRKVEFRYSISYKMLSEKVKKVILVTLNVC